MSIEIEHKFLVHGDDWRQEVVRSVNIIQGYAAITERGSVRVRLTGDEAFLTIKSRRIGDRRHEYEYKISQDDAREMFVMVCGPNVVEKIRHHIPLGELTIEVDEFVGRNAGLILAEIELPLGARMPMDLPAWLGIDVTEDTRYYSSALSTDSFAGWTDKSATETHANTERE